MRKYRLFLPICLLLLAHSDAAWANIYVPSLVEMISSPLMWSIYVVTMVITLPVIVVVGGIETFTVRKHALVPLRKVFVQMCLLNAATSLIRLPFMGPSVVWPGLPISFALTIPAEALLIWFTLRKYLSVTSAHSALALSTRMNLASYAVLTLVVLGLVYIPVIGYEHPEITRGASGRIVLDPQDNGRVLDVASRKFVIGSGSSGKRVLERAECAVAGKDNTLIRIVSPGPVMTTDKPYDVEIESCRMADGHWITQRIGTMPRVRRVETVSSDGILLVCKRADNQWVVYDRERRSTISLPVRLSDPPGADFSPDGRYVAVSESVEHRQGTTTTYSSRTTLVDLRTHSTTPLGDIWGPVFSPYGSKLAWRDENHITIFDYKLRTRKRITVKGNIDGQMAWSPDGRLLAYVGAANPYTSNRWWPNIRVVEVESGKTATLYREVAAFRDISRVLWLD